MAAEWLSWQPGGRHGSRVVAMAAALTAIERVADAVVQEPRSAVTGNGERLRVIRPSLVVQVILVGHQERGGRPAAPAAPAAVARYPDGVLQCRMAAVGPHTHRSTVPGGETRMATRESTDILRNVSH